MTDEAPVENEEETRLLAGFLATRDVKCPLCGYNLRGLTSGRCPECGGPLTVGVMSRVLDLADRPEGYRPDRAAAFERLVPLAEQVNSVATAGMAPAEVTAMRRTLLKMIANLAEDEAAASGAGRKVPSTRAFLGDNDGGKG